MRDYLDDLCGPEGLPVRSPILRVAQIDVPVLLIHGDRDENVPVAQTLAMAEALQEPRQGGRDLHRAGRYAFLHRAAERAGAA